MAVNPWARCITKNDNYLQSFHQKALLRIVHEVFACRHCQRAGLHNDWGCAKELIHQDPMDF